jgi:PadR family transcriptional regulator PadR
MNAWETQVRKGVVELAVLATIARGETYGYRIVEQLKELEGLEFTESTVYPVLTRLAGDGSLTIRTEPSPAGPPRRYYRLTAEGRRRFLQMAEGWGKLSRSLARLIELKGA